MRFLRRKSVMRSFSIFGLVVLINSLFYPLESFALTTGPYQPEYTSYEDAGAVDMVNLLTGDFTFNMPILSVPVGGESSFSVPLSYHAGVGPEQEASWVGLGWNINIGSLTRNINGYPDDASGESQIVNVKDLTGRRGWYSRGLGWVMGWDSQIGHYGVVSLSPGVSVSWDEDGTTVGIGGIYIGEDGGVNAVELGMTILRIVLAVATYGSSEAAMSTASVGADIAMDVFNLAMTTAAMHANFTPPQSPNAKGYWKYSKDEDKKFLYTNYWYWLDQTRIEDMYGTLYLNKAPVVDAAYDDKFLKIKTSLSGSSAVKQFRRSTDYTNKGAASDINIDLSSSANYWDNTSPTLLAYDNYYVNGPGISGNIKPYRMEIGSVSVPREMTSRHNRLNPLPYMDYGTSKVPFVYEGSIWNRYFHHAGSSSASVTSPTFYYGLSSVKETNTFPAYSNKDAIRYDMTDRIFATERIPTTLSTRKEVPQGNYIDWLTNDEIKSTTGKFAGTAFMDYFKGTPRSTFRTSYSFGASNTYFGASAASGVITMDDYQIVPNSLLNTTVDVKVMTNYTDGNGNIVYTNTYTYSGVQLTNITNNGNGYTTQITVNNTSINVSVPDSHIEILSSSEPKPAGMIGGFVITAQDGVSYHYALPVYDYNMKSYTVDKTDSDKNSTMTRSGQFANTWLLTAITGPDFIDRGGTNNAGDGYVDENDWGYWVKFNYGNNGSDFMWRNPYGAGTYVYTSDDNYKTYAEGYKEKYYLNSIETRSHVALFIKDTRKDAKDASAAKKQTLKLKEISLLTRDAYKTLTDPAVSVPDRLKSCSGVTDFNYTVSGSNSDYVISGTKATFIQNNAIRRIVFNTDYALCKQASNSDTGEGKLTLQSISVLGRNNTKILPDYKFTYANNPDYDVNKWDGWGMYSSTGTSAGNTHNASTVDSDGAAWSMSSIKTPLGSQINVTYERDTYSSISGQTIFDTPQYFSKSNYTSTNYFSSTTPYISNLPDVPGQYAVDDYIKIEGNIDYRCSSGATLQTGYFSTTTTISNVGANNNLATSPPGFFLCSCSVGPITVDNITGTVQRVAKKKGGNIRVAAIEMIDPNGRSYKTRYMYDKDNSYSSGVVSMEPDYIRLNDAQYPFYSWVGYPSTPVLYGKVTVLSGRLTTDTDFNTKQVYEFETPNSSQFAYNTTLVKNKELMSNFSSVPYPYKDYSTLVKHELTKRTDKIGKLKSVVTYDKNGIAYSTVTYEYTDNPLNDGINNYQGVFSEGTLLFENVSAGNNLEGLATRYHRGQRTTVFSYPYVIKKITTNVDGRISETTNNNWDLLTGAVLETQEKTPLGFKTKTVLEPAYKVSATGYSELGSKAENPAYKNMLSQIAGSYTYRIGDNGEELGLIGGSINVWKKDWSNYRKLSGSNFINDPDGIDTDGDGTVEPAELDAVKIWRISDKYVWQGSFNILNADGTHRFSASDKYNFASSSNPKWRRVATLERFDHFTKLLESRDMNDVYTSSKFGYNEEMKLADATNAKYEEIAYSSAEDRLTPTSTYFGGEVGIGSGTIVTTPVHTGTSALRLGSGYGFVFKSSAITAGKIYRASVWTSSNIGRIYFKVNGGAEQLPVQTLSSAMILQNGSTWYRIDANITPAAGATSIEVGVKSSTGAYVVFDDFRFQPFEAVMNCYVYNPSTRNLEYVLNDDNLFTRYEYDNRNVVVKTFQEVMFKTAADPNYKERLIQESKEDFRRFYIDQ